MNKEGHARNLQNTTVLFILFPTEPHWQPLVKGLPYFFLELTDMTKLWKLKESKQYYIWMILD